MKKLLVVGTLAIAVGSSALAQSNDSGIGPDNFKAAPYRNEQTVHSATPYDARAQLPHFEPQRVKVPRDAQRRPPVRFLEAP